MQKKILVIGFNTVDIVFGIMGEIENGQKMHAGSMQEYCGGQAANCAYTLARLGNNVSYIGKFGDDENGVHSIESLKKQGIDISRSTIIKNCKNHIGVIFIDELTGERTIIMRKDERLSLDDYEINSKDLNNVELVYSDGNESLFSLRVLKTANKLGIKTVLDVEMIDDNILQSLPYVTALIAPKNIISKIAGVDNLETAIKKLNKQIKIVVATLGNDGSIGSDYERGIIRVPAEKCSVKDTTGAGDAYHAGFVSAMINGKDLLECMNVATKVARLKCETSGPRIEEVKIL